MAAALAILLFGIAFVGMTIGDCFDDARCIASQQRTGHLLWIAPISTLAIFMAVRCIVDMVRKGPR